MRTRDVIQVESTLALKNMGKTEISLKCNRAKIPIPRITRLNGGYCLQMGILEDMVQQGSVPKSCQN